MKIVVFGGSGLIGAKLVRKLVKTGNEIIAASPSSGVNTLTGAGLAGALENAHSVVDVTNSPVFDDAGVMQFFETSTRHILAAENSAGVRHHILLSVVGADRMQDSGYMRAKVAQEELVKTSPVPFSILRATQFFQFLGAIANVNTVEDEVRVPGVMVQPVSADDVASTLAKMALGNPTNGITEIAGPDQFGLDEAVSQHLIAVGDSRQVVTDSQARYFGAKLDAQSLIPSGNPQIAPIRLADWLQGRES